MKAVSIDELIEGLEKRGLKIRRINPTHVASIYRGDSHLGTISERNGAHVVSWDKNAKIIETGNISTSKNAKIIDYIVKSGYAVYF